MQHFKITNRDCNCGLPYQLDLASELQTRPPGGPFAFKSAGTVCQRDGPLASRPRPRPRAGPTHDTQAGNS